MLYGRWVYVIATVWPILKIKRIAKVLIHEEINPVIPFDQQ